MGADKVWAADASRGNGGVMKLLQRWAQSELLALSTLDIELRAAHAANETDDDGESPARSGIFRAVGSRAEDEPCSPLDPHPQTRPRT